MGKNLYIVEAKPNNDIPVFVVIRENDGLTRTLHRNMLLPISHLPFKNPTKDHCKRRSEEITSAMEHTSKNAGEETDENTEDENEVLVQLNSRKRDPQAEEHRKSYL